MVDLLDEYIPFVTGSEINDDPLNPISRYAKDLIAINGDSTAISWLHRKDRFFEKLARCNCCRFNRGYRPNKSS
jgi:magnesium chelatase subunit I